MVVSKRKAQEMEESKAAVEKMREAALEKAAHREAQKAFQKFQEKAAGPGADKGTSRWQVSRLAGWGFTVINRGQPVVVYFFFFWLVCLFLITKREKGGGVVLTVLPLPHTGKKRSHATHVCPNNGVSGKLGKEHSTKGQHVIRRQALPKVFAKRALDF